MQVFTRTALLLSACLPASLAAQPAVPDIQQGKEIALHGAPNGVTACATCHGATGAGLNYPGYPRLAGVNADYLYKQIMDFKSGKRVNEVMQPIARKLSDQQARDITAYFSSLNTPVTPAPKSNPDLVKLGEQLALHGEWQRKNMPACNACHGPNGMGVPPHFPRLAGQQPNYIVNQLRAWKAGTRKNDPQNLMMTIAKKLDQNEIMAVAAYYANLKPAPDTKLMPLSR